MSTPDSPLPTSPEAAPVTPPAYAPPAYPAYGAPSADASYTPPTSATYPTSATPPAYPGYGTPQAPYGGYSYGYTQPRTNVLAIVAMVASILGVVFVPFLGSIAGAIMGHISLRQIARSGENGRGMALAGVIVGWTGLALYTLLVVAVIALFFAAMPYGGYTSYS